MHQYGDDGDGYTSNQHPTFFEHHRKQRHHQRQHIHRHGIDQQRDTVKLRLAMHLLRFDLFRRLQVICNHLIDRLPISLAIRLSDHSKEGHRRIHWKTRQNLTHMFANLLPGQVSDGRDKVNAAAGTKLFIVLLENV